MKKFLIERELLRINHGSELKLKTQKLRQCRRGRLRPCYALTLILVVTSFLTSCDDDQGSSNELWQQELEQLREAVSPYDEIDNAIAGGYDNEFTGYRMQMGYHYLKASLLDSKFEVEKPEVVMYAPDAEGSLQFVGVEYAVPIVDMDNPPPAPEGFTGDADVWEINTEFNVWTLHVWVGLENPQGIFASHNPNLP